MSKNIFSLLSLFIILILFICACTMNIDKNSNNKEADKTEQKDIKDFPSEEDSLKLLPELDSNELSNSENLDLPFTVDNEDMESLSRAPYNYFERILRIESHYNNGQLYKWADCSYGASYGGTYDSDLLRRINMSGTIEHDLYYYYNSDGKVSEIRHYYDSLGHTSTITYYYNSDKNIIYKLVYNESVDRYDMLYQYIYVEDTDDWISQIIQYQYNPTSGSWNPLHGYQYYYVSSSQIVIYHYSLHTGTSVYMGAYQFVGGSYLYHGYMTFPDYMITYNSSNQPIFAKDFNYRDDLEAREVAYYSRNNGNWVFSSVDYYYTDPHLSSNWHYFQDQNPMLLSYCQIDFNIY